MKNIKYCFIFLFACLFYQMNAKELYYNSAVNLYDLFQLGGTLYPIELTGPSSTPNGASVEIEVLSDLIIKDKKFLNILMFRIVGTYNSSTGRYDITTVSFLDPSALGTMGAYYPKPWSSDDIKSSALAVKNYYVNNDWINYNTGKIFNDLLGSSLPVTITIIDKDDNAALTSLKLPGIGEVYVNGKVSETLRFDLAHPCRNKDNTNPICAEWIDLKNLPFLPEDKVDLKYAAHRGFWGDNLGAGPVENTNEAVAAALPYTSIIESDIMITEDKVVVVSHDYNLQRLTNYSGPDPDNTFIYNLNFSQIRDLRLRRRNFDVSTFQFIQLKDLLGYMKQYNTVLTIDVKEKAQRRNPITGICTAACDMDYTKRTAAWVELFQKILEVVEQEDAWEYVAVKTPLTFNTIKSLLPQSQYRKMNKILYFPVVQPSLSPNDAATFICDWYNNAPNQLMGFETNFKNNGSNCLREVEVEQIKYRNALEFVYVRTRLRPGMYPEEPMGPKGIVDRYAQWLFKDLTTDYRGDPFWLMDVPYFKSSILTTDRPDIWQEIQRLYK